MRRLGVALLALVAFAAVPASPTAAAPSPSRWCGNDHTRTDRPDAVSSNQIHVVYAIPADGADRFAERVLPIIRDLAAVDGWWRSQDPTRAPRFDLFDFPGCDSTLGDLDISEVRLLGNAARYAPIADRELNLLIDMPRNLFDRYKKYLVYYDGPVERGPCGRSTSDPTGGSLFGWALVYLQEEGCGDDLGSGAYLAAVAAHELVHNLGAVPEEAPHACSGGHVCDSDTDLLWPELRRGLADTVLDYGHDDYYAHPGSWWDVQDSLWLSHLDAPRYTLRVLLDTRRGSGVVESDLPGIRCPGKCEVAWDAGSPVVLLAKPAAGSRFVGWRGDCSESECGVFMTSDRSVTAVFAPATSRLTVTVRGRGRVVSAEAGISCAKRCSIRVAAEVTVALRVLPARGWRFAGWAGSCRGRKPCRLRMDADRSVVALFRKSR